MVDEASSEQRDLEMAKLVWERDKARLEYKKFLWGAVFTAIVVASIPPSFQLATAVLELVKSNAQRRLDEQNTTAERKAKEVEFRQKYIQSFVDKALEQDIELRIRLAEYFFNVSSDNQVLDRPRVPQSLNLGMSKGRWVWSLMASTGLARATPFESSSSACIGGTLNNGRWCRPVAT